MFPAHSLHDGAYVATYGGERGTLLLVVSPALLHEHQQIRRTLSLTDQGPKGRIFTLSHLVQNGVHIHALLSCLLVGTTTIDNLFQNDAKGVDIATLSGRTAGNRSHWQQLWCNPQKLWKMNLVEIRWGIHLQQCSLYLLV